MEGNIFTFVDSNKDNMQVFVFIEFMSDNHMYNESRFPFAIKACIHCFS